MKSVEASQSFHASWTYIAIKCFVKALLFIILAIVSFSTYSTSYAASKGPSPTPPPLMIGPTCTADRSSLKIGTDGAGKTILYYRGDVGCHGDVKKLQIAGTLHICHNNTYCSDETVQKPISCDGACSSTPDGQQHLSFPPEDGISYPYVPHQKGEYQLTIQMSYTDVDSTVVNSTYTTTMVDVNSADFPSH